MSKIKSASFSRYGRVLTILQSDPLLRKELSKVMVAVCRPDQTSEDFPREVVYVVDQIHKQNLDTTTFSKDEVLVFAYKLLVENRGPIPTFTPVSAPEPKTPKLAKIKPAKIKAAKPEKPAKVEKVKVVKAAKPAPAPAPVPPPEPKAKVKRARRATRPKEQATAEACPPAVEQKNAGTPSGKPMTFVRPNVPYVVGCAALANLQAVLTLLEPFTGAGDLEAKEVCQKLNDLIDDIHRRTVIPSAKEEPQTKAG